MSQFVWLASYPKSGNTWVRAVLANYLKGSGETPIDLNAALGEMPVAVSRQRSDAGLGVETGDLTHAEALNLRPALYRWRAARLTAPEFSKTHEAYQATPAGEQLFPAEATRVAWYILRNPLDVAASMAPFFGLPLETMLNWMGPDSNFTLENQRRRIGPQLRQWVGGWSAHVRSWLEQTNLPVHVLRYEDMLADPEAALGAAWQAARLPAEPERLRRAIQAASFSRLQAYEQAHGLKESSPVAERFFRQGKAGGWRTALTPAHVNRVVRDHGALMERLGYWPPLEPYDLTAA